MRSNLALRLALALAAVSSSYGWAAKSATAEAVQVVGCAQYLSVQPLTLRHARERAVEQHKLAYEKTPAPGFEDFLSQVQIEQKGEENSPLALRELNGFGVSFVSTPQPTSADPATIKITAEKHAYPAHVDFEWMGARSSTTAFISRPDARPHRQGQYEIGADVKVVTVNLHGGGTPFATGGNGATGLGEKLASRGGVLLSFDLPGHGRATRNPRGLTTMEGQIDWILKVIDTVVHPDVKIIMEGHSWGAEFVTYMWLHSDEPKYKRVLEFIALAPPADTAIGGTLEDKGKFGEWWERNFEQFEANIAPGDFEFQKNMLDNGKDSNIGGIFTALSDLDYVFPPLTMERVRQLKRYTGFMGKRDGICYVGREHCFAKMFPTEMIVDYTDDVRFEDLFEAQNRPSRFILLNDGETWKGHQKTGHQVFDLYIPGTENRLVYAAITAIVESHTTLDVPHGPSNTVDPLDYVYKAWSNFPAFREIVKTQKEYVEVDSKDAIELVDRNNRTAAYINRYEATVASNKRRIEADVAAAITELQTRVGLTQGLTYNRALTELQTPQISPETEAQLRAYMNQVRLVEEKVKETFSNPEYDEFKARIEKQYGPQLQKWGLDLTTYPEKNKELVAKGKQITVEEENMRKVLSNLHRQFHPEYVKHRAAFSAFSDQKVDEVPRPDGITDAGHANRLLSTDRSPQRLAILKAYVDQYPKVEEQARAAAEIDAAKRLAEIPNNTDIRDLSDIRVVHALLAQVLELTYVPKGAEKVASIVAAMAKNGRDRFLLVSGDADNISLEKLQRSVQALRGRRHAMVKKVTDAWDKNSIQSARITQEKAEVESSLSAYKETYMAYGKAIHDWLLYLKLSGTLNDQTILDLPENVREVEKQKENAKRSYFQLKAQLEESKWMEIFNSIGGEGYAPGVQIEGDAKLVAELQKAAVEVWGAEFAETGMPSARSLTAQLRSEEEFLESRLREISLADVQNARLRHDYVQAMRAAGQKVAIDVHEVAIFDLLNQPLEKLRADLENPVYRAALLQLRTRWEPLLAELRRLSESKSSEGY